MRRRNGPVSVDLPTEGGSSTSDVRGDDRSQAFIEASDRPLNYSLPRAVDKGEKVQKMALFSGLRDAIREYRAIRFGKRAAKALGAGDFARSEELNRRALAIMDSAFGDISQTAVYTNNLSQVLAAQGRLPEAISFSERTIAILETAVGPSEPELADQLHQLAGYQLALSRHEEADRNLKRALAICEKAGDPTSPKVSVGLRDLALSYLDQARYDEAEPVLQRAIEIDEQTPNADRRHYASCLSILGEIREHQGRDSEAKSLYEKSLAIFEETFGSWISEHPEAAKAITNLARLQYSEGRCSEAEQLYKRALAIYEDSSASETPDSADCLERYSKLLRDTRRDAEADEIDARVEAIRAKLR